jgi:hypothetical protein
MHYACIAAKSQATVAWSARPVAVIVALAVAVAAPVIMAALVNGNDIVNV